MLGSALQPVKAEEMSSLMSVIYCAAAAAAYHSSFYMVNPTLVAVLQPIKMPPGRPAVLDIQHGKECTYLKDLGSR